MFYFILFGSFWFAWANYREKMSYIYELISGISENELYLILDFQCRCLSIINYKSFFFVFNLNKKTKNFKGVSIFFVVVHFGLLWRTMLNRIIEQ
jgi:hypothetical protein